MMLRGLLRIITVWSMTIDSTLSCFSFMSPKTNTMVRSSCYSTQIPHTMINIADDDDNTDVEIVSTRRKIISNTATITSTALLLSNPNEARADIIGVATPSTADPSPAKSTAPEGGVILYTTKSGLRYINLREGTGRTPQYGNLCQVSYQAYVKLPGENAELQEYDSDKAYLIKHGNGRIIPGLDEGLHTLAVGGKRRIIIPPKLGYIGPGVLGPLPDSPWGRAKLNRLLDSMIEKRGGNVVVDVELRSVIPDEADQGYYEDSTINPEDFETLRQNLSSTAREARERGESTVDFFDGIRGE